MGTKNHKHTTAYTTPYVGKYLYKIVSKDRTEEYVKKLDERHAKQAEDRKPLSTERKPGQRMSDAEIYECRDLYENCGWSPQQLRARYGVGKGYLYAILSYQNRSKIIPKEKP